MLTAALAQAAAGLKALADQMATISGGTARVEIRLQGDMSNDRAQAEAIKRGQTPESLAALRKALGL